MTVAPVTVRLSMLSQHHQQQLKEILDSVGVSVSAQRPVTVKLVNDIRGRSKSRERSTVRSRSASRTAIRSRTPTYTGSELQELMREYRIFFACHGQQFRHLHAWAWKPIPPATLVAKVESVIQYMSDHLERDDLCNVYDLVIRFFSEKMGLKNLIEFSILDLLASCLEHRKSIMEVDIFVRIMTSFYDNTDVLFLDFFKRYLRQIGGSTTQAFSFDDSVRLLESIFGHEQRDVAEAVIETLVSENSEQVSVHASYLIYISLWVFHHQRNRIDLRSSQHGFEELVRESFRTQKPEKNLIDSYVDSILELKNQTKILKSQQASLRQSHMQLEQVVNSILADACRRHGCSLELADRLMQAVMSEDHSGWTDSEGAWSKAVQDRDRLLHVVSSPNASDAEIEPYLRNFCETIASASNRSERSYY